MKSAKIPGININRQTNAFGRLATSGLRRAILGALVVAPLQSWATPPAGGQPQTITLFPVSAQTYAPGGLFSVEASASSGLAVILSSDTPSVCGVSANVAQIRSAGTCTIRVSQPGDATYAPAAQMLDSIAINRAPQTISFASLSQLPLGSTTASQVASATSQLPVNVTSLTPATCSGSGTGGSQVAPLALGSCTLRASQAGDMNYLPAVAVDRSVSVTQAQTRLEVIPSANPVAYGSPLSLSVFVNGAGPTGAIDFNISTADGFVSICRGVQISSGMVTCNIPGSFQKSNPLIYVASYNGDTNNLSASASVNLSMMANKPTLSALASTQAAIAGRAFDLSAMVASTSLAGNITFSENGTPLAGCGAVTISPVGNSADTGVARCRVAASSGGTHTYVVTMSSTTGAGFEQVYLPVNVAPAAPVDYTDMWWGGMVENGWGASVTQHGTTQFVVLYVYDAAGRPTWYVMPGGAWNAAGNTYAGNVYHPTGAPFSAYDVTKFSANAPVGKMSLNYTSESTAVLSYTIDGVSGTKQLARQVYASETGQARPAVSDMWWAGNSENGWGINIAQQAHVLFPVWYTYDANGKPTWYAMPGGSWNGTTYTGDLYQPTGSAWLGTSYDAGKFNPVKVGNMSLSFSDQGTASMTYNVNGVTRTSQIARQPY